MNPKKIAKLYIPSVLCFNSYLVDKRVPTRPLENRQDNFKDLYDYGVIFCDIFYDEFEHKIHAIGAPFTQKKDLLYKNITLKHNINSKNISIMKINFNFSSVNISTKYLDRASHYELLYTSFFKPRVLEFCNYGSFVYNKINDIYKWGGVVNYLKDKRVIITMSKDNRLTWIKDFCNFYKIIHKADAIVIYDNCSDDYSSQELLEYLEQNIDMSVVVVRWPVPYGPGSFNKSPWDSDYSQYCMFEHAKYSFLKYAKSILNVDIDELVISYNNRSIFEEAELSKEPIYFDGQWVENTAINCNYSYKDLLYININSPRTATKWCICPSNIKNIDLNDIQYRVHDHLNLKTKKSLKNKLNNNYEIRHFKGITNGWKYSSRLLKSNEENLKKCNVLHNLYTKLMWI